MHYFILSVIALLTGSLNSLGYAQFFPGNDVPAFEHYEDYTNHGYEAFFGSLEAPKELTNGVLLMDGRVWQSGEGQYFISNWGATINGVQVYDRKKVLIFLDGEDQTISREQIDGYRPYISFARDKFSFSGRDMSFTSFKVNSDLAKAYFNFNTKKVFELKTKSHGARATYHSIEEKKLNIEYAATQNKWGEIEFPPKIEDPFFSWDIMGKEREFEPILENFSAYEEVNLSMKLNGQEVPFNINIKLKDNEYIYTKTLKLGKIKYQLNEEGKPDFYFYDFDKPEEYQTLTQIKNDGPRSCERLAQWLAAKGIDMTVSDRSKHTWPFCADLMQGFEKIYNWNPTLLLGKNGEPGIEQVHIDVPNPLSYDGHGHYYARHNLANVREQKLTIREYLTGIPQGLSEYKYEEKAYEFPEWNEEHGLLYTLVEYRRKMLGEAFSKGFNQARSINASKGWNYYAMKKNAPCNVKEHDYHRRYEWGRRGMFDDIAYHGFICPKSVLNSYFDAFTTTLSAFDALDSEQDRYYPNPLMMWLHKDIPEDISGHVYYPNKGVGVGSDVVAETKDRVRKKLCVLSKYGFIPQETLWKILKTSDCNGEPFYELVQSSTEVPSPIILQEEEDIVEDTSSPLNHETHVCFHARTYETGTTNLKDEYIPDEETEHLSAQTPILDALIDYVLLNIDLIEEIQLWGSADKAVGSFAQRFSQDRIALVKAYLVEGGIPKMLIKTDQNSALGSSSLNVVNPQSEKGCGNRKVKIYLKPKS